MPGRGRGWKVSVWAPATAVHSLRWALVEAGVDVSPSTDAATPTVIWCRTAAEARTVVAMVRARLGAELANIDIVEPSTSHAWPRSGQRL